MRKIIVPVDFSASSVKAVQDAVTIAKKVDGEIGIIHVNKVNSLASIFGSHKTAENVGDVERNMEKLVKGSDFKGLPFTTTLRTGTVAKEITTYAEESTAFLIVMGIEPNDKKSEAAWLGTEVSKIINSAPCPVLTIPFTDKPFDLKKIVLPIDTSITTRHKAPFTAELANAFRATVYVLGTCVDESPEFVSKLEGYCYQVRKFLNQANVPNEFEFVVGNNIGKMSIEFAKKINADMITVITGEEPGMIHFKGGAAEQMVQTSPIPILSMHKSFDVQQFAY